MHFGKNFFWSGNLEPGTGVEPATLSLQMRCTAIVLPRRKTVRIVPNIVAVLQGSPARGREFDNKIWGLGDCAAGGDLVYYAAVRPEAGGRRSLKSGSWRFKRIATYTSSVAARRRRTSRLSEVEVSCKAYTGARRMPWHQEAKKDAEDCDNPRGAVNGP